MVKSLLFPVKRSTPSFLLFIFLAFFSFSATSQTDQQELDYFLIENLSPTEYSKIKEALSEDGQFEVATACIPASVVSITTNGEFDSEEKKVEAFRKVITDHSALSEVNHLPDFDSDKFMSRCKEFRTRKN